MNNIGNSAFAYCTKLGSVVVAGSDASIGPYAFEYCNVLTNVIITNSVVNIGDYSFQGCRDLATVSLSSALTNIGESAFSACPVLSTIIIPGSITNIGSGGFSLCSDLTSVYFTGNAPQVDSSVFSEVSPSVKVYYLPKTIGWSTFNTYSGLKPAILWNPTIQTTGNSFGVRSNQFGFNITGTNNFTVVVEACTNLSNPSWQPLSTNTLANGSYYFSDPQWSNYPARYYGLGFP